MKTATQQRILVVDDNVANRELLEALLIPQGYDVVLANSGEQCLEFIASNPVDMVMLDVMMPGMNGFQVADVIRSDARTETLPILMITALGDTQDRIAGIEAGCDDFISKPFDRDEVLARTRAIFRMNDKRSRQVASTTAEVAAIRHQLEDARRMQEALYPSTIPDIAGFDTWGTNLSSLEVSGDYYDVIVTPGGRCLFVLADVCGKGVAAALLAANIHAGVHGQTLRDDFELADMMKNLNRIVADNSPPGVFATMIVGEVVADSNRLCYIRAGHELPCVIRADGSIERPAAGNGLLGIDPDMEFELVDASLDAGDVFCIYTDGVTDAEDTAGEPFGLEALERVVRENRSLASCDIGDAIVEAVDRHACERTDDMTLIVTRRRGSEG